MQAQLSDADQLAPFAWSSALTTDEKTQLLALLTLRTYPPCTNICIQGEVGNSMYFILSGRVEFYGAVGRGDHQGEKLLGSNRAGDFFGEAALYGDSHLRTATVRSVEAVTLLELPYTHRLDFLEIHPELTAALLKGQAKHLERSSTVLRTSISAAVQRHRTPKHDRLDNIVAWFETNGFLAVNSIVIALIIWLVGRNNVLDAIGAFLSIEALLISTLILRQQHREKELDQVRDHTTDSMLEEILQATQEKK